MDFFVCFLNTHIIIIVIFIIVVVVDTFIHAFVVSAAVIVIHMK